MPSSQTNQQIRPEGVTQIKVLYLSQTCQQIGPGGIAQIKVL